MQFGGHSEEEARQIVHDMQNFGETHLEKLVLRRDLPRSVALWIAASIQMEYGLRIVSDNDTLSDEQLLDAPKALELPETRKKNTSGSLGFWDVVGAVVLGIIIASFL